MQAGGEESFDKTACSSFVNTDITVKVYLHNSTDFDIPTTAKDRGRWECGGGYRSLILP